jgi:trehalose 6-phosphate phosphatase
MNQNLGDLDVAEMPLHKDVATAEASPTNVPAPGELAHWDQCAILLDIDGTLLDLAPTPREV